MIKSSTAPTELESEITKWNFRIKTQKLQNELLELKKLKYQMQVENMKNFDGVDSSSDSD